jgi:hypothetical protein
MPRNHPNLISQNHAADVKTSPGWVLACLFSIQANVLSIIECLETSSAGWWKGQGLKGLIDFVCRE